VFCNFYYNAKTKIYNYTFQFENLAKNFLMRIEFNFYLAINKIHTREKPCEY